MNNFFSFQRFDHECTLFLLAAVVLLSACGTVQVGVEQPGMASPTPRPGEIKALLSATPIKETPSIEPSSVITVMVIPLPGTTEVAPTMPSVATDENPVVLTETTATGIPPGTNHVSIMLIALDDGGKAGAPVGCGDSVVPVTVEIPATQGLLKAALDALLANKSRLYGDSGLYNALYQSDLKLDSAKIVNGLATIQLSGNLSIGDECDNPRVKAQLENTTKQFSTVTSTAIFINGKPLDDALSLKK